MVCDGTVEACVVPAVVTLYNLPETWTVLFKASAVDAAKAGEFIAVPDV